MFQFIVQRHLGVCIAVLLLNLVTVKCQSQSTADTGKIFNSKQLQKGFYASYDEFISNAPSIIKDFTVVHYVKTKDDSTIIGGDFKLSPGSKKVGDVWGFCDGNAVYVKYNTSTFGNRYWKLEDIGPFPVFTFTYKNVFLIMTPVTPLPIILAREYRLMVITENGRFRYPDIFFVKKLLKNQPDLLDSLEKDWKPYEKFDYPNPDEVESDEAYEDKMNLTKDYLRKLNERLQLK